jgi:hypothetical protein
MHFFIFVFIYHVNLIINKHISYIIVLQCWNTAARKNTTRKKCRLFARNVKDY